MEGSTGQAHGEEWENVHYFHAHVYFEKDKPTEEYAKTLREGVSKQFPKLELGTFFRDPVGPHPVGNFQVLFTRSDFADVVAWLAFNRNSSTSILVHPITAHQVPDHSSRCVWLGQPVAVDIAVLERMDDEATKKGLTDEQRIQSILRH